MLKFKIVIKAIVILIIVICLLVFFSKTFIYKTTYLDFIEDIEGNNIDPYLILSIIKVESKFNPNACSNKEAKGLMQIIDSTISDVENIIKTPKEDINLYIPEINIEIGTKYFNKLVNKYDGNYYIALLAYNGGMGNVDSWISKGLVPKDLNTKYLPNIPFRETKNYLKKVITTYNIYKLLYNK